MAAAAAAAAAAADSDHDDYDTGFVDSSLSSKPTVLTQSQPVEKTENERNIDKSKMAISRLESEINHLTQLQVSTMKNVSSICY